VVEDSTITLRRCSTRECTDTSKGQQSNHLIPRSHKFQTHFSLSLLSNRDHGLQRELQATGSVARTKSSVTADSQVIKCNRFGYQQIIHILLHCRHQKVLDFGSAKKLGNFRIAWQASIPSQYILIGRCIDNSVQDTPVFPLVEAY